MARIVKEAVSDAITNHLNDPRIEGFVSVTRVDMSADLRVADVYLSIFGQDPVLRKDSKAAMPESDAGQNKTFLALTHARNRIQSLVANKLQSKFCPVLRLHTDESLKKTLEIMKLIDRTAAELKQKDSSDQDQD